jgi:hypothetical protein
MHVQAMYIGIEDTERQEKKHGKLMMTECSPDLQGAC